MVLCGLIPSACGGGQTSPPRQASAADEYGEVPPRLLNREELLKRLQDLYPSDLKERGLEGTIGLEAFVDTTGHVTKVKVSQPSAYAAFNEVAEEITMAMVFDPALRDGKPVGVWTHQTVSFSTR